MGYRRIQSDDKCYGCGVCKYVCQRNAIFIESDEEGFDYPVIDEKLCINCGECERICPLNNLVYSSLNNEICYAFVGNNDYLVESSSEGFFPTIAEAVIENGGAVCAASFTKNYREVKHIIVEETEDIKKLQKSKYIQSSLMEVIPELEAAIKSDRLLLFVGVPCQVMAIKTLFPTAENLITVDLVCHGVPSKYAWEKYLEEIIGDRIIDDVNFCDKHNTIWSQRHVTIKTTDGEKFSEKTSDNIYMQAFLNDISTRKACGNCDFPYISRVGDITIGDFWGIGELDSSINEDKGVSIIICNSEKGERLFRTIKNISKAVKKLELNSSVRHNCTIKTKHWHSHIARSDFFDYLKSGNSFSASYDMAKNKKYDFAIAGLWYGENYGAALTSFALCKAIEDKGYTVLVIDIPDFQYVSNNKVRDDDLPTRRFINRNCHVSKRYKTELDMVELNDLCDAFICGSDQVWRPYKGYYGIEEGQYLFSYVSGNKKKISYATSFGEPIFDGTDEDRRAFGFFLNKFDYISVREEISKKTVRDLAGVESEYVVDPVFLISAQEWKEQTVYQNISSELGQDEYLFLYLLQPTEEKQAIAKIISEKKGLRIIAVSDLDETYTRYGGCSEWTIPYYSRISVEDWLFLVANSSYVLTDSYHGMCFALIFEKQFRVLEPRNGKIRISELLKKYNLEDLQVFSILDLEKKSFSLSYKCVKNQIRKDVERSNNWLFKSMTSRKDDTLASDYEIGRYDLLCYYKKIENRIEQIESGNIRFVKKLKKELLKNRKIIIKLFLEKRLNKKKVAIRGGGVHTSQIIQLLSTNEDIYFKCVWDFYTEKKMVEGLPVVQCEEELDSYGIDTILISSFKYGEEMLKGIENIHNYEIVDLYKELEKAGIDLGAEYYWY